MTVPVEMSNRMAYKLATLICQNRWTLEMFIDRYNDAFTHDNIKLVWSCVNKQQDMIDIVKLNRYFPK